jgi:flagellar basal-body rod modification protein FlgD
MPVSSVNTQSSTPPADMISSRSQSLDRADFLKMLMTQIQHQDPTSPMSNEEFASQMAQFSSLQELQAISKSLDQSIQTNLLLAQSYNNTMATSLIGKVVKANSDTVHVAGNGDTELSYSLGAAASKISIEIHDADGNVVRTIEVNAQDAGNHSFTWDGLNADGKPVAAGDYTFTVSAAGADGESIAASTYVQGVITSVNYEDGTAVLMMGDMKIQLSQVLEVMNPSDHG